MVALILSACGQNARPALSQSATVTPTVTFTPTLTFTPSPSPTQTATSTATVVPFDPAKLGTVERDVTYCTVNGVPIKMDVYYPATATGPWPAVVLVHGGAWITGDKATSASLAI